MDHRERQNISRTKQETTKQEMIMAQRVLITAEASGIGKEIASAYAGFAANAQRRPFPALFRSLSRE
jgi:hypothetical protein